MAQRRFHSFEADLDSFSESLRFLGILEPGVVRGYDRATFNVNTMTILHDQTGASQTNIANDNVDSNVGILITKQGLIIQETSSLSPLTVDTNQGNSLQRIDYLIVEHAYPEVAGGAAATYSIIKGPIESNSEPVLTNPNTQVLIGKIYIPAGASDHSTTTYIREQIKGIGGSFSILFGGPSKLNSYKSSIPSNDLNLLTSNGLYKTDSNPSNKPPTGTTGTYIVLVMADSSGNFTFQLAMDAQAGKTYSRVKGVLGWSPFVSLNNSDITANIDALNTALMALTTRVDNLEDYNATTLANTLSAIATDIDNLNTLAGNIQTSLTNALADIASLQTLTTTHSNQLGALHNTVATRCFSNLGSAVLKNLSDVITSSNGVVYSYVFPNPQIPVAEFAQVHGKTSTRLFGFVRFRLIQEGANGDDITADVQAKGTADPAWVTIGRSRVTANDWGFVHSVWFDFEWGSVPGSPLQFRIQLLNNSTAAYIHTTGPEMEFLVMVN